MNEPIKELPKEEKIKKQTINKADLPKWSIEPPVQINRGAV